MFICHGNICRSPMAEFIMKDLITKKNLDNYFYITSKATSNEEYGNPIHYETKNILEKENIYYDKNKRASKVTKEDYNNYDYFIVMDDNNLKNISYIFNDTDNKVYKLLTFNSQNKDIEDPWYTGDFEKTYEDVTLGCTNFLEYLIKKYNLK